MFVVATIKQLSIHNTLLLLVTRNIFLEVLNASKFALLRWKIFAFHLMLLRRLTVHVRQLDTNQLIIYSKFSEILEIYFLCATCIIMYVAGRNLLLYYCMLSVSEWMGFFIIEQLRRRVSEPEWVRYRGGTAS